MIDEMYIMSCKQLILFPGMFMVCAELRSRNGFLVDHTCRSAMLHYRSTLLHMLTTLIFSPMMIFGNVEEKQDVILELFSNFEEDQVIIFFPELFLYDLVATLQIICFII